MAEVTCEGRSIREINVAIKSHIRGGDHFGTCARNH